MEKLVGAFYQDNACIFSVWAPLCNQLSVIINKDRKISLERMDHGYWEARVPDVQPGDLYLFELDGKLTRPDPASLSQPKSVHEQSEVVDRNYQNWTDQDWVGISMPDMIMYELHVGTFTSEGTFEGVIEKLDYLKELGINTIEIMPISQFPGDRNWGYDGVFPFAVQNSYGGMNGLKKLVNHCHQKGIAVVLDVVYNHMGPEGNYLSDFGPYFTDKYGTPWGKAINFDDAESDPVRSFFIQNALMWLDNFHMDGLRLDAVHAIKDLGTTHFLQELSDEVKALEQRVVRPLTLIAESDLNDVRFINPIENGGYNLTGQWIDEFHHALHALITKETNGYYSDFGDLAHLSKAYEKTFVYDGIYSPHRKKKFGGSAEHNPFHQFVVFSQNHDQIGNRMLGERLSKLVSYETLKVTAAAVLLSPYIPMLYMGEEYGEEKPFQYFVSHTDPDLVEAVRNGRKSEFAYFQKEGLETPDPQSEQTFKDSTLSWDLEDKKHKTLFNFYKALIHIRKSHPAMKKMDRDFVSFDTMGESTIIMTRKDDGDNLLIVLLNFGDVVEQYTFQDQQELYMLLNSSSNEWLGNTDNVKSVFHKGESIEIKPSSAIVLSNSPL